MPLGFNAVTRYVLANSFQREAAAVATGSEAGATPARSSLKPRYSRYSPPAVLTTVNQKAEAFSSAPKPSSDSTRAVESPSATASTSGRRARLPYAME
ncbi:hypothetical protein G6F22_021190 [Rhizopus arrhizus]|nr:hypothetical protein G6F22_021190 [Rhizopus arrhizus]KAG1243363.1 hypothetical protein G6F65_022448 [Rhizopus arrhizus]